MRKFIGTTVILVIVLSFMSCTYMMSNFESSLHLEEADVSEPSILFLKLEGIIMEGGDFLEDLREYSKQKDIKGVLIQVDSPGGVVGPSQEIYTEIKQIRDVLKKPVIVSVSGLGASGAYYAAQGANKIFVNAGSLVGSIGVIMEFANLEKLYEWAKIERYVIKTGAFKDSGAEYRPMREDEKTMFQNLANEILGQFKRAVAENRKMKPDAVDAVSDGRVFTGETAVRLGLADNIGTLRHAQKMIGEMSGLGAEAELFTPSRKGQKLLDFLAETRASLSIGGVIQGFVSKQLWGQPLFIMPQALPAK
jgi:protease-4